MVERSRLDHIRARAASAALACGRRPETITLVAVSKTQAAAAVAALLQEGQREFGENRVQEAMGKFPALRAREPSLRLHLIGSLQTNKAREAVRGFDVIETLDRPRLADALEEAVQREGRQPELLVQVNIGDESQKAGVSREAAEDFIASCQARFGAALTGLMCIPPAGVDPAPYFEALAGIAARCGLTGLSMGMSDDFEAAIAAGATQIRVGSALFGARLAAGAAGLAAAGTSLASVVD